MNCSDEIAMKLGPEAWPRGRVEFQVSDRVECQKGAESRGWKIV